MLETRESERIIVREVNMRKELRALFVMALLAAPYMGLPYSATAQPQENKKQRSEMKYGDKVTIYGEVTRPTLKSDAESVVKSIEGVTTVVNNIEVLPLSPMDDQLRRAVFRAVYGDSGLSRYSVQAVPSIHIIVKNGNVTLEGVVDNETDKNLANLRANGVPNVFSVKNNLVVAGNGK